MMASIRPTCSAPPSLRPATYLCIQHCSTTLVTKFHNRESSVILPRAHTTSSCPVHYCPVAGRFSNGSNVKTLASHPASATQLQGNRAASKYHESQKARCHQMMSPVILRNPMRCFAHCDQLMRCFFTSRMSIVLRRRLPLLARRIQKLLG